MDILNQNCEDLSIVCCFAGWALGSLQLLGSPAGLARSVGTGLRSFVTLPYQGIIEGPTGFLFGIIHGSASLMKHVTAGTHN